MILALQIKNLSAKPTLLLLGLVSLYILIFSVLITPPQVSAIVRLCRPSDGTRCTPGEMFEDGTPAKQQVTVGNGCADKNYKGCLQDSPLVKDIRVAINFLAAGVGVIVTGSIIFAGIQYITAQDNAQQVAAAKKRIYRSIFALVTFFLTYAFLQFLIPGGAL
jgi:hypothetical protein